MFAPLPPQPVAVPPGAHQVVAMAPKVPLPRAIQPVPAPLPPGANPVGNIPLPPGVCVPPRPQAATLGVIFDPATGQIRMGLAAQPVSPPAVLPPGPKAAYEANSMSKVRSTWGKLLMLSTVRHLIFLRFRSTRFLIRGEPSNSAQVTLPRSCRVPKSRRDTAGGLF